MEKFELLTKSDLEEFKNDLLQEVEALIKPQSLIVENGLEVLTSENF